MTKRWSLLALVLVGCEMFTGEYELQSMDQTCSDPWPERRCRSGRYLERCTINDSGERVYELEQDCMGEALCVGGSQSPRCIACVPGRERRCEGSALQVCNADGTDFELELDCSVSEQQCDPSMPGCVDCFEDDAYCDESDSDVLWSCRSGKLESSTCAGSEFVCLTRPDGSGYCQNCDEPGTTSCTSTGRLQRCDEEFVTVLSSCDEGQVCDDGNGSGRCVLSE